MQRFIHPRAAFTLPIAIALMASIALVAPARAGTSSSPNGVLDTDAIGIATGGGTIEIVSPLIASFGFNAKRPPNFQTGGPGFAAGRINFDRHGNVVGGRHVNVPVTLMKITVTQTPTPNGTGGDAQIVGNCEAQGAECPSHTPAFRSVVVLVTDTSDSGAGSDAFQILYCTDPGTTSFPAACPETDGGGTIRTGNVQIRPSSGGSGGTAPLAPIAGRRLP